MKRDVNHFVLSCDVCVRALAPNPKHKADLGLFRLCAPMQELGIAITGGATFQKASQAFKYILSVIDHFTNWAVAVPMKHQTTETVAQEIFDLLVTRFGLPKTIHS